MSIRPNPLSLAAAALIGANAIAGCKATADPVPSIADKHGEVVVANFFAGGRATMGCSGTLIAPRVVITAAHCAEGSTAARVVAPAANGQSSRVAKWVTYSWVPGESAQHAWAHDIALLILERPIALHTYAVIREEPCPGCETVALRRVAKRLVQGDRTRVSTAVPEGHPFTWFAAKGSGGAGGPVLRAGAKRPMLVGLTIGRGTETNGSYIARLDDPWLQQWITDVVRATPGMPAMANENGVATTQLAEDDGSGDGGPDPVQPDPGDGGDDGDSSSSGGDPGDSTGDPATSGAGASDASGSGDSTGAGGDDTSSGDQTGAGAGSGDPDTTGAGAADSSGDDPGATSGGNPEEQPAPVPPANEPVAPGGEQAPEGGPPAPDTYTRDAAYTTLRANAEGLIVYQSLNYTGTGELRNSLDVPLVNNEVALAQRAREAGSNAYFLGTHGEPGQVQWVPDRIEGIEGRQLVLSVCWAGSNYDDANAVGQYSVAAQLADQYGIPREDVIACQGWVAPRSNGTMGCQGGNWVDGNGHQIPLVDADGNPTSPVPGIRFINNVPVAPWAPCPANTPCGG